MLVLVVSQFFPPEIGAAQNRVGAFVDGLMERGHDVTVVCEQPNHPSGVFAAGFGRRPVVVERRPGLTVRRLWVAASPRKTTVRRLALYGSFAAAAAAHALTIRRPDVVFSSSPPLPGAVAAAAAARARRIPFVLDVRDLWTAAVQSLRDGQAPGSIIDVVAPLERALFRSAHTVTTTTEAFCEAVDAMAGRAVSRHLPNGAMDDLLALPDLPRTAQGKLVVGYAGNIGIFQRIDVVLDTADLLRSEPVRFVIVGDGPLAEQLREDGRRRGLDNVEFRRGVPPAHVGEVLMECDVLLSVLAAHPSLDAFIPSKTYDAMAVGRAVVTTARGEGAALVSDNGCGVVVAPEDPQALAEAISALAHDRGLVERLGAAGRAAAAQHARSRQLDRLDEILRSAAGA